MRTAERFAVAAVVVLAGIAALAHYDHWSAVAAFAVATAALAGMAWVVSLATSEVGERLGSASTGLLQATVGNLPELFVVIFALHAGEQEVAQSAIVGSLFANALLVLGVVVIVGALRGARRDHALRRAGAARRLDAAAGLRLHHRAGRHLAVVAATSAPTTSRRSRASRRCCCWRSIWPG